MDKNSPALSSDDTVANRHLEARGHVGSKVLVPLLITIVLLDVVQVVTAKDHGALHLVRHDDTTKNAASDGDLKKGHNNTEGTEKEVQQDKNNEVWLTFPVKGHFLSMYPPVMAATGVLKPRPTLRT